MEWRVRESWDLEEQNADVDQSEGRERWFLCSFSHSVSSCDWSAFPLNYSRRKESMGYRPVCQLETGVCGLIPMCPWANLAYLFCLTVSQYHIVLIFFFSPSGEQGGPQYMACGISVPRPGIELRPWQWKCWILTTGPPGNSFTVFIFKMKW